MTATSPATGQECSTDETACTKSDTCMFDQRCDHWEKCEPFLVTPQMGYCEHWDHSLEEEQLYGDYYMRRDKIPSGDRFVFLCQQHRP